ncbi:MAG TPA: YraN family protein [Sphingomonadaceae bacterium]
MNRAAAEKFGRLAEARAALWLNLHGWWVVASRVKTPLGEIDLIARRGRTVAFVEVKARKSAADLDDAIDEYRLRRVAAAAEAVAARYVRPRDTMRIDVLLLAPRRFPRHIVNAWMP